MALQVMKIHRFDSGSYSQTRTGDQSSVPLWQALQKYGKFDANFQIYRISQASMILEIAPVYFH